MQMTSGKSARLSAGIYLFLCAVVLAATVLVCNRHFSYALDDPYIHLALSERIWHGNYGINAGEITTPSSSVIWPFLLAPFAAQPWGSMVPLVLNIVFGTVAAWLLGSFLDTWYSKPEDADTRGPAHWLLPLMLVVAANLVGLTFVGMEHVLQVLLAIGCAIGVLLAYQGSAIPNWCVAMAILAPAVRYEDLALTLGIALILWIQSRRGTAIAAFCASLVLPLCFGLFLHAHHLPMLPNSVLAKGGTYGSGHSPAVNLLMVPLGNLKAYLTHPQRWAMLILLGVLLWMTARVAETQRQRRILWSSCSCVALAILLGKWGWYYRYEVFAEIFGLVIALGVLSSYKKFNWKYAVLLILVCGGIYLLPLEKSAFASREIYRQQYQMHRFLDDYYDGSVAINDLGWVSYHARPGIYILDLAGLASKEALQQKNKNAAWLDQVTREHSVGLAMIYPDWFTGIPESWTPVAVLHETPPTFLQHGSLSRPDVAFYSTSIGDTQKLRTELAAFAKTLPPGTSMTLDPDRETTNALGRQQGKPF